MKTLLSFSFFIIFGTLVACAPASAPVSGQSAITANKTVSNPPPNAAVVQVASARRVNSPICFNNQKLGVLEWRSRAHLVIPPGQHVITASTPDEQDCSKRNGFITVYRFNAQAGKSHVLIMEDRNQMKFALLEKEFANAPWLVQYPLLINHISASADLSTTPLSTLNKIQNAGKANTGITVNLDQAKKECSELGFEAGTGDHGKCVMELMK